MQKETNTITLYKRLKLNSRKNSPNWPAMLTLENGNRVRPSTGSDDVGDAEAFAWKFFHETDARISNGLPAQTQKFKHVAEFTKQRMKAELDADVCKLVFKDYIREPILHLQMPTCMSCCRCQHA